MLEAQQFVHDTSSKIVLLLIASLVHVLSVDAEY